MSGRSSGIGFHVDVPEEAVRLERARARELRRSSWWKRKLNEGICHYCRGTFPAGELTMDHLVPLIRGGKSVRANCVCACKSCNAAKKYQLPLEWQDAPVPDMSDEDLY